MTTATMPDHDPGHAAPLAVEGVVKRFGGVTAVNGVGLAAQRSEIIGLIGPNGSGKSTLFNCISGLERCDQGSIRLEGQDVADWPAWRIARAGLGRTFQIPSLFENMSVRDNLLTAAVEGDWKGAPGRAAEALDLLQLDHVRDNLASELSGGQQKLLEFGRVYMRDPKIVLLDEVTAGVHLSIRKILLAAIEKLRTAGTTFLVIEHDMELVREVCDRIVVMNFGELVAEGAFEEIAEDANVRQAYLGRQR